MNNIGKVETVYIGNDGVLRTAEQQRILDLEAQVESLQNKWASRPLSREDQAKWIAALEAAILRLSVKCNGETGCPGYQLSYDLGLCPPRSTEETPEAMHARIVTETADAIASQMETKVCAHGVRIRERCHKCYPWTAQPSGMEIAQREADEAAGDNDPRDRVWGAEKCVKCGIPLPPLEQWSMPACPTCTGASETKGEQG